MNKEGLNRILKSHKDWCDGKDGQCADLSGADLRGAGISGSLLYKVNFSFVNLSHTDLSFANLSQADLSCSNLSGAKLNRANLMGADLRGADLSDSDLSDVCLQGANLAGADLRGAIFCNTNHNPSTAFFALQCPEKGSFIGYKAAGNCLVELLITEDALRSSSTSRKCRCSKAKVLSITDVRTGKKMSQVSSDYDRLFIYRVGEIVESSDFDTERWNACSSGIHFFITSDEAIQYGCLVS